MHVCVCIILAPHSCAIVKLNVSEIVKWFIHVPIEHEWQIVRNHVVTHTHTSERVATTFASSGVHKLPGQVCPLLQTERQSIYFVLEKKFSAFANAHHAISHFTFVNISIYSCDRTHWGEHSRKTIVDWVRQTHRLASRSACAHTHFAFGIEYRLYLFVT